jgi:mannose-6-phosphate isomerase-like protein (cupin superfamily)
LERGWGEVKINKMEKVNLAQKLSLFNDHYNPRIVGELNNQHVKLVKLKGEFVWHKHDVEDELFLVIKGTLRMEYRDRTVEINEGEFIIVPHGVEHKPSAAEEVHILLFEPAATLNTGDVENEMTRSTLEKI